jgi:DNA-binding XRE family transcriptional regulator
VRSAAEKDRAHKRAAPAGIRPEWRPTPTVKGSSLRELREAHGLSQAQLGHITGLNRRTLYPVEHDVEREASDRPRRIVAAALGVPAGGCGARRRGGSMTRQKLAALPACRSGSRRRGGAAAGGRRSSTTGEGGAGGGACLHRTVGVPLGGWPSATCRPREGAALWDAGNPSRWPSVPVPWLAPWATKLVNMRFPAQQARYPLGHGRLLGCLMLHPAHRGGGLADRAARLLARHLIRDLDLHRLELECYGYNERAIKHAERTGYVREGVNGGRTGATANGSTASCSR